MMKETCWHETSTGLFVAEKSCFLWEQFLFPLFAVKLTKRLFSLSVHPESLSFDGGILSLDRLRRLEIPAFTLRGRCMNS